MKFATTLLISFALFSFGLSSVHADVVLGTLFDFQDGTIQGWAGGTVMNVADSGPGGVGDHSLQLSNGGNGNFAMFNSQIGGVIDMSVSAISADLFRPQGEVDASIRLVLFGTDGTRWTSSAATIVAGDGAWNRYSFSVLEADLTRVVGTGTYSSLISNLDQGMFRHDPGAPSAGGSSLAGTMNFDNIAAIPEPSQLFLLVSGLLGLAGVRRKSS